MACDGLRASLAPGGCSCSGPLRPGQQDSVGEAGRALSPPFLPLCEPEVQKRRVYFISGTSKPRCPAQARILWNDKSTSSDRKRPTCLTFISLTELPWDTLGRRRQGPRGLPRRAERQLSLAVSVRVKISNTTFSKRVWGKDRRRQGTAAGRGHSRKSRALDHVIYEGQFTDVFAA